MRRSGAGDARRVRVETYVVFFLLFAAILFLAHLPLLNLPYFWDEAGQFVPAALDLLRGGAWIPHSTAPNIHPPGLMAYLAAFWSVAGFNPVATRAAMLLVASFTVLAAFLLAIELSREVRGAPAFLAVALLCVSPLFFAQAMLAQLDAPAMLFTCLALLLFLQDRIAWSAAACVALVLVKETGLVAPLVFAGWLAKERRWRDAAWFAAPVLALAAWVAALQWKTGHWMGNPEFIRYNLYYPLHPVRLGMTLLRRLYYLCIANFHWIGTAAIVYAWRKSATFAGRAWRVAWTLTGVHVAIVTLLGGAVLERYLLPIMPIIYTAMAAGLSLFRPRRQIACSAALVLGMAACNFVNPPYPFPYEDNLAFSDFVKLQADTADYLEHWYPRARIDTVWPLTQELSQPDLGFVTRRLEVGTLADLAPATLASLDWKKEQVVVVYSHTWDPAFSFIHNDLVRRFWSRFYGYVPNATMDQVRAVAPFPIQQHLERHGQWVDVYVNPELPRMLPKAPEGLQIVRLGAPAGVLHYKTAPSHPE